MKNIYDRFDRTDREITRWMAQYGMLLLRISLGVIFFWFGVLKFFPGLSPAEGIASHTIELLTGGLVSARAAVLILAVWECLIGLGLIIGKLMRITLLLLFLQMLGTLSPVVLIPHEVFAHIPYAPTLEGQYIIKNLVLISAGFVLGSTVRDAAAGES